MRTRRGGVWCACKQLGESPCLLPTPRRQRAQLVRVARVRVSVAHEEDEHGARIDPARVSACPRTGTSSRMSSPTGRSRATSSPSSPTRAGSTTRRCRRSRSRSASPRRRSCSRRSRAARRVIRIFTPKTRASVRGPSDPRHRLGAGDTTPAWCRRARDRSRDRAGRARARRARARSSSVAWSSRCRASSRTPIPRRSSARSASPASRFRSSGTTTASGTRSSASARGTRSPRLRPDFSALTELEVEGQLLRGRGHGVEDADVRALGRRPRGSGDRLGRRASRCPRVSPRARRWGEWIEISQGAEIGRPSTLFALADARDGEHHARRRRRPCGRRRPRRVPALGIEEAGDRLGRGPRSLDRLGTRRASDEVDRRERVARTGRVDGPADHLRRHVLDARRR